MSPATEMDILIAPSANPPPQPAAGIPAVPVQSFKLSTLEVPRGDQFEIWRRSYAEMLDLTADDADEGFCADHQVWDLGTLAFSHIHTQGLGYASLVKRGRRDPLDHWLLTLFLQGRSTTLADSDQLNGDTGMVQIHPLGRAFEGRVSQKKNDLLMLFVPRDFCRDMAHVLDAAAFSRLEGGMGQIFADYMISLARRLPLLDASDLPELTATTHAMLQACIAPSPERLEEAENAISSVLLERARRYIQTHLADPNLGSTELMRELGISRSRLYRLFESAGGVMHYIQRRRLPDRPAGGGAGRRQRPQAHPRDRRVLVLQRRSRVQPGLPARIRLQPVGRAGGRAARDIAARLGRLGR